MGESYHVRLDEWLFNYSRYLVTKLILLGLVYQELNEEFKSLYVPGNGRMCAADSKQVVERSAK